MKNTVDSFQRYLSSKRSVDDRALNRLVWDALAERFCAPGGPHWRILEIGAGTGTMFQRMVEWGILSRGDYTAVDAQADNIRSAREALPGWAAQRGGVSTEREDGLLFSFPAGQVGLHLQAEDLFDFARRAQGSQPYDLIVANAFFDLVDFPNTLPLLLPLLHQGGLLYATINFDGLTILEPEVDPLLDEKIMRLYHQTMDERVAGGQRSGDSRTGRRMFAWLRQAGMEIIEAGSSDWAVFSRGGSYPGDEAYFLRFILRFFEESLAGHPELPQGELSAWLQERQAQIERGELVYIAHQMDFLAQVPDGG